MSAHRSGGCRCVSSNLEFARQQVLHTFLILNNHDQVDTFQADLQSRAPAANGEKRRCAPAIRSSASCYTFAVLASEDEATFNHVWYYGHALCVLQYLLWDSLVGRVHDGV